MRLGWVVDGDLDQVSGGYLYDRLIIDDLRPRGVEIDVLSLPLAPYLLRLAGRGRQALERRLPQPCFDVLIEDELSHPALLGLDRRLRGACPRTIRVSLVHHLRSSEAGPWAANEIYRRVERAYLRSVDAYIFNSRTTQAVVQSLAGSERPSVVAVPGADRLGTVLDARAVERRARERGALKVLFVGNLIERKGLLALVEAFALLPPGSALLTIVGREDVQPGYARRVHRVVRRFRLGGVVRFRGALGRRDLSETMARHDVLAVPSTYEGYGMAYLEGMGLGLPPIAGSNGGAREFIHDDENGFLISAGDAAGLAAALNALASDRDRLARLSLAALHTFRTHPTWSDAGSAIFRFLEGLTREAGRRATP